MQYILIETIFFRFCILISPTKVSSKNAKCELLLNVNDQHDESWVKIWFSHLFFPSQSATIRVNLNNSHYCKTFVMIHSAAHFYYRKIKKNIHASFFFILANVQLKIQDKQLFQWNWIKNKQTKRSRFRKWHLTRHVTCSCSPAKKKCMTVIAWHKSYNGQRTENRDGDMEKKDQ